MGVYESNIKDISLWDPDETFDEKVQFQIDRRYQFNIGDTIGDRSANFIYKGHLKENYDKKVAIKIIKFTGLMREQYATIKKCS